MWEARICARVSTVLVSFCARHRLKGPLLCTFPCRVGYWHVRASTLHQGSELVFQGLAAHVPLWMRVSPVVIEVSDHCAKHLQPAR